MLTQIEAGRKGPEMKKHENCTSCNVMVFLYQRKPTDSKDAFYVFARFKNKKTGVGVDDMKYSLFLTHPHFIVKTVRGWQGSH